MKSYNKVILIGNMVHDPELKYTPGGTALCTIVQGAEGPRGQGEVPHNVGQAFPDAQAVGEEEIPF